jgi:CO dehydrogenase maturation factor
MCGAHATVRGLLGELVARSGLEHQDLIVDMEAGLEHLSRGTGKHVSQFIAVLEPYYRSMETVRRIVDLARELGVADVQVVTNKIRNDDDRAVIRQYCETHGLTVIGEVPYDTALIDAERAARPPVEFAPDAPAVRAIRELAARLTGGERLRRTAHAV